MLPPFCVFAQKRVMEESITLHIKRYPNRTMFALLDYQGVVFSA